MDGGDIGSETLQSSNWEVYKDAFAPPQPARRVKPWERAPVQAHAPRLQGQKVWKKVNIKPHLHQDDKEIHDAAQAELEKAGMGARKRPRMIGGKENIADAPWKKGILDNEELGNWMPSPKKQRLSMAPGDADAFVIPRKRTNANHLITPRKLLRKTTLTGQAQAIITTIQNPLEKLFHIPLSNQEPLRDVSKIPAKPSLQNIPLNDLVQDEGGIISPLEEPVRRRKSLRQSTRRLMREGILGQPPAAIAEETLATLDSVLVAPLVQITAGFANCAPQSAPAVDEAPQMESELLRAASDSSELQGVPIRVEGSEEGSGFAVLEEPHSLKASEILLPGPQQESEISVGDSPATLEAADEDLMAGHPMNCKGVLLAQTFATVHQELSSNETGLAMIEAQSTVGVSQTPKSLPPVLNSTEPGTRSRFVSPTKSAGTPQSRRKTPQRRGSRRSTRSTRANSVPPEDLSTQQVTAHEVLKVEISDPTNSPVKSRVTEIPTLLTSKSRDPGAVVVVVHTLVECDKSVHSETTDVASKPSGEIETQNQVMESTEIEPISNTQSSDSTSHSKHVEVLVPVFADISSAGEIVGGGQNLAITATHEGEIPVEVGILNNQEDVAFEVGSATAIAQIEDEHISSRLKSSRSEELAQDDINPSLEESREPSVEALEVLEPISISISIENLPENSVEEHTDNLPETSTPNPSTELVETISKNAPANSFDHDDTDMLRNFLTRVKANKAAKAGASIPKRKRSLPHSPIRLPLGNLDSGLSPSSPKSKDEFDVSLPRESSAKRKLDGAVLGDDEATEPKPIRRSGRTRLPVKAAPLAAPSFIPVRRLGQDGDNTVTLRRSQEKELAALTRVNTRKNKGVALPPIQMLAKQAEEKEDPASRQRALKEVFDEKAQKQKKIKKGKTVVWAEELAKFQIEEGKTAVFEGPQKEKEKAVPIEEKSAVKVGVRSKMTLGMVVNGTPAPKRKMRGRS